MTTLTVLNEQYGVAIGFFDPTPILWASEEAARRVGVDKVRDELKKINRWRERRMLPVVVHQYGHALFN